MQGAPVRTQVAVFQRHWLAAGTQWHCWVPGQLRKQSSGPHLPQTLASSTAQEPVSSQLHRYSSHPSVHAQLPHSPEGQGSPGLQMP